MNRKRKSMITAILALIIALAEGALSMLRMKVILSSFGDSANAIMQIAVQISAYLVLFESGMTAAYQLRMYRPLADGEIDVVTRLWRGLKKNLLDIVIKMFIAVNISAVIYVYFLLNTTNDKTTALCIFAVMGLRFVTPYIATLPEKTILIASEKGYVSNLIQGFIQCSTMLLEIALCLYTELPLPTILLSYILFVIAGKVLYVVYRKYKLKIDLGSNLDMDLEPKKMTNDILVHQIAGMVANNTDNFLLSIMQSLFSVTVYSAYTTVINYPTTLFNTIINSVKASIIVKIQKKDANAYDIYENMLRLSSFIMSIVAIVFFLEINDFVSLWIGNQYQLDTLSVAMFACMLYIRVVLNVLTIGVDAKGIYRETKHIALAEAGTNLFFTVLLIPTLGVKGALIGTTVSLFVVKAPLMSSKIYKVAFEKNNPTFKIIFNGLICSFASVTILQMLRISSPNLSWGSFIYSTIIRGILTVLITSVWFFLTDRKLSKFIIQEVVWSVLGKVSKKKM